VVVMAGASAMIVMYANREDGIMESSSAKLGGQLYGIVLLPVSLAFIVYALWQCEFLSIHLLLSLCFITPYLSDHSDMIILFGSLFNFKLL